MRNDVIAKICDDTQRFADILKKTKDEGGTVGDALLDAVQAFVSPEDPERIFFEWFISNKSRLREACKELGIEMPAEGKNFYRRLKAAAMERVMEAKANAGLAC
jgi:hypothetical protein